MLQIEANTAEILKANGWENQKTVIAVSGGADSVALLLILSQLISRKENLQVAHFHHQARSCASQDQVWVGKLAGRLGISYWTNTANGMELIPPGDVFQSPVLDSSQQRDEASLRKARYAFLEAVAHQTDSRLIALAHHADDQLETVVHHLIRGTGLRGAVGIPNCRELASGIQLVRPLLQVTKQQILEYLKLRGETFREDPTNVSNDYTRNKIRNQLIPLLNEIQPQAGEHLREFSAQLGEVCKFHESLVHSAWEAAVLSLDSDYVRLDVRVLRTLPPFLCREFLISLWERQHWSRGKFTRNDWIELSQFIHEDCGQMDLPHGFHTARRGEMLAISQNQNTEKC